MRKIPTHYTHHIGIHVSRQQNACFTGDIPDPGAFNIVAGRGTSLP
jgi:hypothetical protein